MISSPLMQQQFAHMKMITCYVHQETQMKVSTIDPLLTGGLVEGLGMRLTVGALKSLTTARASTSLQCYITGGGSGSGESF